jgi:hypothetical protein
MDRNKYKSHKISHYFDCFRYSKLFSRLFSEQKIQLGIRNIDPKTPSFIV